MKKYERIFLCRNVIAVVCIVILLSAILSPTATMAMTSEKPTQAGNIIFILDASGSMWGQIEGRTKIDIAKEVLSDLVKDLPEDINSGLVAYGHRRKGDCNDVQELIPLKKIDKPVFFSQIQAISPKGKTPMIRSVHLTAEKLKGIEEETRIILISDGKETCDEDPCARIRELRATGIRFVMHVIGFNVTKEEKEQLECMAEAGGGRYFTADNAGDLLSAAREIVEESQNFGYLKITALLNSRPIAALIQAQALDNKARFTAYSEIKPDQPGLRLTPGVYNVIVTDKETINGSSVTINNVKIELGKTFEQTVNLSSGVLELTALKDGNPFEALFYIYTHGEKRVVQNGYLPANKPGMFKLPAGKYDIVLTDKTVLNKSEQVLTEIEVISEQTTKKTVEFPLEGTLEITAVKGKQPFEAFFYIYPQGENIYIKSGYLPMNRPGGYKLLPGAYDLKVIDKTDKTQKELNGLAVQSGQTCHIKIEF